MKQTLMVFAKNMIYGEVKTRLAATIGDQAALSVYQHLTKHTCSITNYLPVEKIVFYSRYIEVQDEWDASVYKKQIQSAEGLGQRMKNAFDTAFHHGSEEVVIIGTDCIELTSEIIMNAFAYLKTYDVVIGPAIDGGYYLLGMKKCHPQLFENISWSTSKVFNETLVRCKEENLSAYLLPALSDIDDENDLKQIDNLISIVKYD